MAMCDHDLVDWWPEGKPCQSIKGQLGRLNVEKKAGHLESSSFY